MPLQFNPLTGQLDMVNAAGAGISASITGNTAGVPALISSGTMYLAGGNNVTLSQNGNTISINGATAGAAGGIGAISAGTQTATAGTVVYSNSNNVTFGMSNNSVITASASYPAQTVDTNKAGTGFTSASTTGTDILATLNTNGLSAGIPKYLTTAQPVGAYLTTAMASNRGTDFVQATAAFNGTNASGTIASNNISVSVAAQSTQTQNLHNVSLSGNTAGVMAQISSGTMTIAGGNNITLSQNGNAVTISGPNTVAQTAFVLSNSNGVSFGTNGSTVTATVATNYQSQGAYLTTAMQSNAATISNINLSAGTTSSNLSAFSLVNSNGVSFGLDTGANAGKITATVATNYQSQGAYLTTARASNDAIGLNTALTANGLSVTANSSGLSLNVPAWLTTAMQSASSSVFAKTGFTTASTAGTDIVGTHDTNGLSMGIPKYITTAQPVGAYLTTARASNDGIGTNTAQSNVTWTANSSGLSLDARGYAGTNTTFNGANISGSITQNSNGINISLSANPAGGADGVNILAAGTQTANTTGTVLFNNGGGVTFGMSNSSVITATVATNYQSQGAYLTTARASNDAIGLNTAQTNVTWTVNSSGISLNAGAYLTTAMASNRGTDFVQANAAFAGTNASGTIASNGISVSVNPAAAGVGVIAGTRTATTAGNILFDNANGVTFGLDSPGGSIMTASHNALTTARASNDGIGLNTAQTNVTWTVNSSGISLNAGAYLTTAQPVGAYLTTARASNDAVGLNTAATNVTWTVNSSGISLNAGAYLTTAQPVGAYLTTARASNDAIGLNTALTANGVAWTVNSSGLSLNVPAFLTTAMQSASSSVFAKTGFTSASTAGSDVAATLNTNGLSVGMPKYLTTAQAPGAYLTTARASTDAVGLNTAGTNVTWTVNSSGISLNAGAYLTTAMASNRGSDFVQANAAFNGTNASGTIASNGISISVNAGGGVTPAVSNSAGSFTFSTLNFSNANNVTWGTSVGGIVTASVAAPGAAAENNWMNLLGANTAGNTTASGSTIGWSGINLTLSGTNASAINISAPATSSLSATGHVSLSTNGSTISVGAPSPAISGSNGSFSYSTLTMGNLNGMSFYTSNGSVVGSYTVPAVTPVTVSRYNEFKESPLVAGEIGNGSLHIQPWLIPNLQFDRVVVHKAFSNASNSSFSFTVSDWVGIYTQNVSTLSLLHSVSASTNFSGSGTVGSYLSYGGGIKAITVGLTQTLTEGQYWIGAIQRSTTGGGAGHTLNQALNSNINSTYRGLMGAATNATNQMSLGFGAYSATTSAMPASIAFTQINGNSSVYLRPPSLYFVSGTI